MALGKDERVILSHWVPVANRNAELIFYDNSTFIDCAEYTMRFAVIVA
jgi:hypothetical protein